MYYGVDYLCLTTYQQKKGHPNGQPFLLFDFEAKDITLFLLCHRRVYCGCCIASFKSSFKHNIRF